MNLLNHPVRTERRFGVTASLTPEARQRLLTLRNDEGWADVLDVMEMCCIEIETELINTAAADESAVLANHKKAQVAWQIFTHLQSKIDDEITTLLRSKEKQPLVPPMTPYQELMENILDPTKPLPSEEYAEKS